MSDTGLFSGIYEQVREYAEMLDKVLIHLKDGSSSQEDPERQELGRLFVKLAEPTYDDPSNRRAVLLLSGVSALSSKDLKRAGEMLLGSEKDGRSLATLERFAHDLEQEGASAMARMRGNIPSERLF